VKLRITDRDPGDLGEHQVYIRTDGIGRIERLEVDGVNVAGGVNSLHINGLPGEITLVRLGLHIPLVEVKGLVRLEIPTSTAVALEQLGWHRPTDEQEGPTA
jgi:hypothetical protein